jgi:hypothetical protein
MNFPCGNIIVFKVTKVQTNIMTPEQDKPGPEKPSIAERLLDAMLKNPFVTMWNLALVIGGLIALIYFAQLGYLPDLDLKTASSFLLAVAFLGIFLSALLILVFNVPGLMMRSDRKKDDPDTDKSFAFRAFLWGATGASFWLLMFGVFGLPHRYEVLGRWISLAGALALVVCIAIIFFVARKTHREHPLHFIGRDFIRMFMWLIIAPSLWYMAVTRFRSPSHDDIDTLLLSGVFMIIVIAFNAGSAVVRLNSYRGYTLYFALSVSLPMIYLWMPTESKSLPTAVFSGFSFGGLQNTAFIVKEPACKGLDVLAPGTCTATTGKDFGCVKPILLASRVGSEFLLIIKSGERQIKVPVQKTDVLTWGIGVDDKSCALPVLPRN